jgi:hypothetical protein
MLVLGPGPLYKQLPAPGLDLQEGELGTWIVRAAAGGGGTRVIWSCGGAPAPSRPSHPFQITNRHSTHAHSHSPWQRRCGDER